MLLKRFWPECPYKLIMGTDVGKFNGVETIEVGVDLGWSNNCIEIVKKIKAERIIMFFEDFLPCAKFNNNMIRKLVRHSFDYNIGCLRLQPCPGPTAPWKHCESLGILQPNDRYRFSLQTALWKKSTLLSLLKNDESPWEAEVMGSKRARKSEESFVSVKRGLSPTPYIVTAIVKGKWQKSALDLLRKERIPMGKITPFIK
jgi:hypothetical protein